jgi:aspartate/glutamate racemase
MDIHIPLERKFQNKLEDYFFNQMHKMLKKVKREKSLESIEIVEDADIQEEENKLLILLATPFFIEMISSGQKLALDNMGMDIPVQLNTTILNNRVNRIVGINDTVWKNVQSQIFDGVNAGESIDDITERIRSVYKTTKKRAKLIARTEVTAAINFSAM